MYSNGIVKNIDFGLAEKFTNIFKNRLEVLSGKSPKRIVGTPSYMSPESLDNKYDYKGDIWSVGIMLY